ncbi:unnamed protein product [Nezara viridula]|uniref:Uncharacterized protein n=1 Tax=Nezara viridula TaxID=85310 RepID=A0A9P0HSZ0_NEZVI|nr:unnamed protein product [Nezara viridula]
MISGGIFVYKFSSKKSIEGYIFRDISYLVYILFKTIIQHYFIAINNFQS